MNIINFENNYNNKLNCDIFTTIRKTDRNRYENYLLKTGEKFNITLNNEFYCLAQLIKVDHEKYSKMNDYLLVLDTGMTNFTGINQLMKKYGLKNIDDNMIILTFKKIKLQSPNFPEEGHKQRSSKGFISK